MKTQTSVGAREVQRKLNFSSPALATYHLEKLETLGLVKKTPEGYTLLKEVKVGAIAQVVKFGSLLLPPIHFAFGFSAIGCSFAFALFANS